MATLTKRKFTVQRNTSPPPSKTMTTTATATATTLCPCSPNCRYQQFNTHAPCSEDEFFSGELEVLEEIPKYTDQRINIRRSPLSSLSSTVQRNTSLPPSKTMTTAAATLCPCSPNCRYQEFNTRAPCSEDDGFFGELEVLEATPKYTDQRINIRPSPLSSLSSTVQRNTSLPPSKTMTTAAAALCPCSPNCRYQEFNTRAPCSEDDDGFFGELEVLEATPTYTVKKVCLKQETNLRRNPTTATMVTRTNRRFTVPRKTSQPPSMTAATPCPCSPDCRYQEFNTHAVHNEDDFIDAPLYQRDQELIDVIPKYSSEEVWYGRGREIKRRVVSVSSSMTNEVLAPSDKATTIEKIYQKLRDELMSGRRYHESVDVNHKYGDRGFVSPSSLDTSKVVQVEAKQPVETNEGTSMTDDLQLTYPFGPEPELVAPSKE